MPKDLLTIPEELLIKILSNLDAISLIRCTMTCTLIHNTFKSSSLLEYIVQLHFNGVCTTGKPISLPYSELVEYLRKRRQAQMFPKWTMNATLEMRSPCVMLDLAGRICISTDARDLELALLPTAGSPSQPSGVVSKTLKHISINNFAIDMSQILIVLMEDDNMPSSTTDTRIVKIHIRTIADTPHPRARQSILQFTITPDNWGNTADNSFLQIARNILVLYYNTSEGFMGSPPRVLIWDWVTSNLIVDSTTSTPPLFPSLKSEFALLDSNYFFITCVSNSGSIQLYEILRSPTSNASVAHLATLHFPSIAPHVEVERIAWHAGPIEFLPLPHTPFAENDNDRLHVFTMEYTCRDSAGSVWPSVKYLNVFVHQRVLKTYCNQRATSQDLPLNVPWASWGPPNTKIIYPARIHGQYSGKGTAHGQRVVLRGIRDDEDTWYDRERTNSVEVLDFSLAAVLFAGGVLPTLQSSSESKFTGKLLSSSKINASQCIIFEDDVETFLPCVSFTADLDRSYARFMIYADGVIGLKMNPAMCNACLDVYTI